jgi:hypothetical protein
MVAGSNPTSLFHMLLPLWQVCQIFKPNFLKTNHLAALFCAVQHIFKNLCFDNSKNAASQDLKPSIG